jgi:hypothetical protein
MRTLTALVFILASCSIIDYGTARHVTVDSTGGCLAIPTNSNDWPTYYRQKAEDLITAKCPNGYVIEREAEVVTGQTVTTNTTTDSTPPPVVGVPLGPDGIALASFGPTTDHIRHTTNVQDRTEWRIWYRKN